MLLEVEALRVRLGAKQALDGVTLSVGPAEVVAVVGASGAGKSTLAQAVLRLLPPGAEVSGAVRFRGGAVLEMPSVRLAKLRGGEIGIAFQETGSALDPLRTVGSQVLEVMRAHGARGTVEEALGRAGIADAAARAAMYPHQLSGGLRQRAMLAMAISARPALLIADEPTSALDPRVASEVLASLGALRTWEGMAILLITHDLGVVAALADRVVVLHGGRAVEEGRAPAIFEAPAHEATRALLSARMTWPPLAPLDARFACPAPVTPLLEARGISRAFGRRRALAGVSLSLARGEVLGIAGESGAGKSTLARVLAALDRPDAGEVLLDGAPRAKPGREVQLVFQDPASALDPRMRARDAVAEGLVLMGRGGGEVDALLAEVGLGAEHAARFPHALSGGEKQRVAIARALAVRPEVVIADEPVAALDAVHRKAVLALLVKAARERGAGLVLISHDLAAIARFCDRVLILYEGAVVETLPAARLRDAAHPYTRALIAALPPERPAR